MSQLINEKFEEMVAEMQLPSSTVPGSEPAAPSTQSKTAVNAKAEAGDQTPGKLDPSLVPGQAIQDLGGPTPTNNKSTDDSNKLKDNATLGAAKDGQTRSDGTDQPDGSEPKLDQGIAYGTRREDIEVDLSADVAALAEGEQLSEKFLSKAATIFEAAVKTKIGSIVEELEAQYNTKLAEEVEKVRASLAEEVDGMLKYTSERWLEENQVAIDNGLKVELTESFIGGLKSLFDDHYIDVPEGKEDVLESMNVSLREMEDRLNEQIDANVKLSNRISEFSREGIVAEMSEGLTDTQKEKFAALAEAVSFKDEETYREKLNTIKGSYFSEGKSIATEQTETPVEGLTESFANPAMAAYVKALGKK
nr:scaffold prohead core protein [uncultured Mediterranean phage uvMED]BAR29519.1 scaffold prohead core protein [uncultured Mediterranean phage uvMED]